MGIIEDIQTALGSGSYTTIQGTPGAFVTVELVSGPISDWANITTLLSLPANYEDLNISMLDGQTCSVYGFDAENTVVVLNNAVGGQKWCHCTKYANGSDYTAGKTLLTPDVGLRV